MPKCQYCGKQIKNKGALNMHEAHCKKKKAKKEETPEEEPEENEELTKQDLGLEPPQDQNKPLGYCDACMAPIFEKTPECPNCGSVFEDGTSN